MTRLALLCTLTLICAGCSGKEAIVLVPVEGKLMMDGKPVPHAQVDFMPEFKGHGAEANSTAVTDENGKFVLMKGQETGAAIATHRVVVTEGPTPAGTRGQDDASQNKLAEFQRGLKNRPLPTRYSLYSSTPLRAEIKGETKDLVLEMKR